MAISNVSSSSTMQTAKSGTTPLVPLSFGSLDAMEAYLVDLGKKATETYQAEFQKGGNKEMTVDELKDTLRKRFPGYTLTETEPKEPVKGKNLLYIDDANLKKMATDADYRARVMGLMEREYAGTAPTTFNTSAGVFHAKTAGSVFSVSDTNKSEDGVPYAGMAIGEGFVETGPRDSPLPSDFLSKTSSSSVKKPGSAAWLKELIEKRQADKAEADKRAAAEAQKKASEERAAKNGVDIVV